MLPSEDHARSAQPVAGIQGGQRGDAIATAERRVQRQERIEIASLDDGEIVVGVERAVVVSVRREDLPPG